MLALGSLRGIAQSAKQALATRFMYMYIHRGVSAFTFRAGAGLALGPPMLATSSDLLGILSYVEV